MGCGAGKVTALNQEIAKLRAENEDLTKQLQLQKQPQPNGDVVTVPARNDSHPQSLPGAVDTTEDSVQVAVVNDTEEARLNGTVREPEKSPESTVETGSGEAAAKKSVESSSGMLDKESIKQDTSDDNKVAPSVQDEQKDMGILVQGGDDSPHSGGGVEPRDPSTTEGADSPGDVSAEGRESSEMDSPRVPAEPDLDVDIEADLEEEVPLKETVLQAPNACCQCFAKAELFQDPTDMNWYCELCWSEYYGSSPVRGGPPLTLPSKLVPIESGEMWTSDMLSEGWECNPIAGWPPRLPGSSQYPPCLDCVTEAWSTVRVRVDPLLCGPHARETLRADRPYIHEMLACRYRVDSVCGHGHFTRALLATDMVTGNRVCVKRHHALTVELLTDVMCIGRRLEAVDPRCEFFPKLLDAFYDMSGYTVEAFVDGRNCLEICREDPCHFADLSNLRHVANGVLRGLILLAQAGVVHCDVKPDNVMWTEPRVAGEYPSVRIVDFGCSRLDRRLEAGRNWSLAEGGAGHLGKWAPEMALRLPITDRTDVWGMAISLLELYCGRVMWCSEDDTVEIILAQLIGLCDLRDGLPPSLLRKSPLDITRLYTPAPQYFPVRKVGNEVDAPLEVFKPTEWGLSCVIGPEETWDGHQKDFAEFIKACLTPDPAERPSAAEMLNYHFVNVPGPPGVPPGDELDEEVSAPPTEVGSATGEPSVAVDKNISQDSMPKPTEDTSAEVVV